MSDFFCKFACEIGNTHMKDEIVLYQPDDTIRLEVRLQDDTVWLSLNQIAQLFDRDKSVISRHIREIFKEHELQKEATVAKNATVQIEGGREVIRQIEYYNLDVIISTGYRVKSQRGVQFRQWANRVLKEYILHGYALNQRFVNIENQLASQQKQLADQQEKIDFFVRTSLPPKEGIFMDGQIFDAYELLIKLVKSAKSSILLIDNYVDESVLTMMSEKSTGVQVDIYTKDISKSLALAESKFNSQYGDLSIHQISTMHDRFMIIDDKTIYLIGASLKDAGKRLFAFTQISAGHIFELKKLL